MIQSIELRIGNLIEANGPVMEVKQITQDWVELYLHGSESDTWGENLEDCNPIPLTPEILGKCGFVKNKHKIDVYEKGRIRIWFNGRGGALAYLIEEDTAVGHYIPIELSSVHQLQNFIYALTGEELEVKL